MSDCLQDQPVEVFIRSGLDHYANGDPVTALKHFETGLDLYPDTPEIYNNVGNIFRSMGNCQKAVEHFQSAKKLAPGFFDAYYNLGAVYLELGDFEDALSELQFALAIDSRVPELHWLMGECHLGLEQPDKALQHYKTSVQLDRACYDDTVSAVSRLFEGGFLNHAIDLAWFLLEIDYRQPELRYLLGYLFIQKEKNEEAEINLKKAIDLGWSDYTVYCFLGGIECGKGNYKEAERYLEKALEWDRNSYDVRLSLAELHVLSGNHDSAAKEALRAMALNEMAPEPHIIMANIEHFRGDLTACLRSLETAFSLNSNFHYENEKMAESLYQQAEKIFSTGCVEECLQYILRAKKLNSDNPDINRLLGIVHHISGDLDSAVDAYETGVRFRETPEFCYLLGCVHVLKNDYSTALNWMMRGVRLESDWDHLDSFMASMWPDENVGRQIFAVVRFAEKRFPDQILFDFTKCFLLVMLNSKRMDRTTEIENFLRRANRCDRFDIMGLFFCFHDQAGYQHVKTNPAPWSGSEFRGKKIPILNRSVDLMAPEGIRQGFFDEDTAVILVRVGKTASTSLSRCMLGFFQPGRFAHTHAVEHIFESLPPRILEQYRFIHGHKTLGLHRILPRESIYFTMLRNPVKHFISSYYHWNTPERIQAAGNRYFGADTLERYADIVYEEGGWSSQLDWTLPGPKENFQKDVFDRIDRIYALVGLTEYFGESLLLFSYLCGLPVVPESIRDNVNPHSVNNDKKYDLPTRVMNKIEAIVQKDMIFYERQKSVFKEKLAKMREEFPNA